MSEDYYEILGVDHDAAPETIRQAYRSEAKKSHPDASGSGASAERFRAVEEAYETLRDRDRRAEYDRRMRRAEAARPRPQGGSSGPLGWSAFDYGYDALEELARRLRGIAFPGRTRGGFSADARQHPELLLEVLLSSEEASRGTAVRVEVPAAERCPYCGGLATWEGSWCGGCAGSGVVRSVWPITLEIPPGVHHGAEFRCQVELPESRRAGFQVRVLLETI